MYWFCCILFIHVCFFFPPASELHLATTWPQLTEGIVVDNDVYSWVLDMFSAAYKTQSGSMKLKEKRKKKKCEEWGNQGCVCACVYGGGRRCMNMQQVRKFKTPRWCLCQINLFCHLPKNLLPIIIFRSSSTVLEGVERGEKESVCACVCTCWVRAL